jgi:hypothetical protein
MKENKLQKKWRRRRLCIDADWRGTVMAESRSLETEGTVGVSKNAERFAPYVAKWKN